MESEVTGTAMNDVQIDLVVGNIEQLEASFFKEGNQQAMQDLIEVYNKAIEYYSAFNNDKVRYILIT